MAAGRVPPRVSAASAFDPHIDRQAVAAAAQDDASQRRDIAEVAAPRHGDVVRSDHRVVRGVELEPTEGRRVDRDPRVRAAEPTRLRHVTAHIARGEPSRAQAGDHEVREVLTHSAADLQHFGHRGRDGRCAGRVLELGVELRHECLRARENRALRGETVLRVVGEHAFHPDVRRLGAEADRFQVVTRGRASGVVESRWRGDPTGSCRMRQWRARVAPRPPCRS